MTDDSSPSRDAATRSFSPYLVFAGFALAFSIIAICLNWHRAKHDYHLWYVTGQDMLHGRELYTVKPGQQIDFIYPPPAAWMLAPTTVAGVRCMTVILTLANSLAWGISILLCAYLATGAAFGRSPWIYLIPAALTVPYVWETYILGQPNLLLLACLLAAFVALRQKKQWTAGALIGFTVAVKAFPITALGYLLYRRLWRAAVSMAAAIVFFAVIFPAPFRGFERNWNDLTIWTQCMVLRYDAKGLGQRSERSYSWQNQSLVGVAHRLLRHVNANSTRNGQAYVNITNLTFKQANLVVLAAAGLLGIGFILLLPPRKRQTPQTQAIEWAMLLVLMLVASPYQFGYYSIWLMLPYAVLVEAVLSARREGRPAPIPLLALIVCPILLMFAVQFKPFYRMQMYGNIFWADLLILAALGAELWRCRRDNAAGSQVAPGNSQLAMSR
jgi:hypothetical protein